MGFLRASLAKQTTQTAAAGTLTLIANSGDTKSLQTVLGSGPVKCRAMLRGQGYFEHFRGTFTAPATLTRDEVIESSNAGSLVNIPSGTTTDVYLLDYAQFLPDTFTTNKTLTNKDIGNTWLFTGTAQATLTFPAFANALPDSWGIVKNAGTAPVILTANGSETFDESLTTVVALQPGESAWVFADLTATIWRVIRSQQAPVGPDNSLLNSRFLIDQANAGASTAITDGNYSFDGWYALTQTASINVSQLTDPEDGFTHAIRLTQSQASAQRMGLAQVIEGKNCKFMRGGYGSSRWRVKSSTTQNLRYFILGWTGTEDAPTKDVVNNWTSGIYTPGNFFLASNVSVLAGGVVSAPAGAYAWLPQITGALGSSFNNIYVLIFTENTCVQNVTLDIDYAVFRAGTSAVRVEQTDDHAIILAKCQRCFQERTFGASEPIAIISAINGTQGQGKLYDIAVQMRATPALAIASGSFVGWNVGQSASGALSAFTFTPTKYGNVTCSTCTVGGGITWTAGQAVLVSAGGSGAKITLDARLGV